MALRYTTKAQDMAFIQRLYEDSNRVWKVGDACLSHDLHSETTIVSIIDLQVTLANGDQFHVSKVRRIK